MRNTVLQWAPRGRSGTGMCREKAGNCSAKTGFFNKDLDTQVEPPPHHRRRRSQVGEGTFKGGGTEQGAGEVAAGDLAGTAGVRRPRAARSRRGTTTKEKNGGRTADATREKPTVLCRLMGAQAGHHRHMSVVPATDGEDLEQRTDSVQRAWALQPD